MEIDQSTRRSDADKRTENKELAHRLRKRILLARNNDERFDKDNEEVDAFEPSNKHFLIMINPAGGKGKAEQMTDRDVLPIMHEAGFTFEKLITTHQGHAEELAQNIDPVKYDALVLVGGDGLFHEVVNGLMKHSHKSILKSLPLFQLPGGSGNCVAGSLGMFYNRERRFYYLFEVYHSTGVMIDLENVMINSLVLLATGKPTPIGLSKITQPDEPDRYSFLLAFWGLYSKIDFDSEKYRKSFGGGRFLVSALANIAKPTLFDGHIEIVENGETMMIYGPFINVSVT